jgi:hypothetical protein
MNYANKQVFAGVGTLVQEIVASSAKVVGQDAAGEAGGNIM